MTDTAVAKTRPRHPEKPSRPPFRRRAMWIPVAAAMAVIVFTIVAAWVESPSPGADDFLSPRAVGGDGSSRLADSLADDGVSVSRFTEAGDSFLDAVSDGDATVFLPAPDYLNRTELSELSEAVGEPGLRLVFVDPSRGLLDSLALSESGAARIAPKIVAPDAGGNACGLAAADAAGDASMLRQAYAKTKSSSGLVPQVDWNFCYDSGLAWTGDDNLSIVVAGSPAVFTDAYFDQAGNAELATGLLGRYSKVVWLDKHVKTTAPPTSGPEPTDFTGPPPSDDPGGRRINYPDEAQTNPLYDAMPAWMWAMLLGVLVLGVGLALWKGRRLGPPVTEPLPVTVPAAETVHGRARLYRRARAHNETLRALRAGALHRIQPILGLSSQATPAEVIEAVAVRTGWSSEYITATLYSDRPDSEAELYDATRAIDALVSAVETDNPQGSNK